MYVIEEYNLKDRAQKIFEALQNKKFNLTNINEEKIKNILRQSEEIHYNN
jgi:hypothetical protein